jgi:signal transduction histidine kinase
MTLLFGDSFEVSPSTFYKDESATLSWEQIKEKKFEPSPTENFGFGGFAVWKLFQIKNLTDKTQQLYALNNRTTLDAVDAYLVYQDQATIHYTLGDTQPPSEQYLKSRFLNFPITLQANEEVTLWIKHESRRSIIETHWLIKDAKSTYALLFKDNLFFGLYIGMGLILLLIPILLYLPSKKLFLLYYFGMVFCALIGQLIFNGTLYALDLGIPLRLLEYPEIIYYCVNILLIYFYYDFFEIKYEKPKLIQIFRLLPLLPLGFIFADLFISLEHLKFFKAFSFLMLWMIVLFLIVIGIKKSKQGIKGGWFYVFGQSLSLFMTISTVSYVIYAKHAAPIWSIYSFAIGMMANMFFLSIGLYFRLKEHYVQSNKKSIALAQLTRFQNSEMIVNNIIHQWKAPLSKILTILTNIQAEMHFKKDVEKTMMEYLPQINKNATLLTQIVQEFYKFNVPSEKTVFSYKEEIEEIKKIFEEKIEIANANIQVQIDEDKGLVKTDKFAVTNTTSVLINNFLDTAISREIAHPDLTITVHQIDHRYEITFSDNCGGINYRPIEKIFDPFESTDDNESKGLGLFIAKTLVEEKLQGKLSCENHDEGARFILSF